MIMFVVFARCVYVSGDTPRAGSESVQGRQMTVGLAVAESLWAADEASVVKGVGEKGGRPGFALAVRDLETRS